MSNDVMIDLETLGTLADSTIVSIGAVRFDLETGQVFDAPADTFYQVVNIAIWQRGRCIDGCTVQWWMGQSDAARAVFKETGVSLPVALVALSQWMPKGVKAWSNGADFDLPMLTHAYRSHDMEPPWGSYLGRCYRTYKNLPGARDIKMVREGTHHNALADAIDQARHLCAIHKALFGGKEQ